jgi:taurine dioxygenase
MPALEIRPLSDRVGAEILGLDLSRLHDGPTAAALRDAYARHHLLLLRDQPCTAADQARFARLFGDVELREKNLVQAMEPDTQHVSNVRADGVFGRGDLDFHLDQLFQPMPLKALILAAIEVPAEGGDTVFADATAVAGLLPEDLRREAEAATCRHAYTFAGTLAAEWNVRESTLSQTQPMLWPVPGTNSRALWVNKLTTVEVLGRTPDEGRAMMQAVRAPLYDEAIQYRHHWQPGDLVLWNNRTLQHARTPFDETLPRTLRRTPIN